MACNINPVSNFIDDGCDRAPFMIVPQHLLINGAVSKIELSGGVLSFNIGAGGIRVSVRGVATIPDWLNDGQIIEVDLANGTITEQTQ